MEVIKLRKSHDKEEDLIVRKSELGGAIRFFLRKKFVFLSRRFFHIGFGKITKRGVEVIDLQYRGLSYNNVIYFDSEWFFNKKSRKVALALGIMLHLIVNKRNASYRRKEFEEEWSKLGKKNKLIAREMLLKEYGKGLGEDVFEKIERKQYSKLRKMKWKIIVKKASIFNLLILPFIFLLNRYYKFKNKRRITKISFLGPDGGGKTTAIKDLSKYFDKNKIKYVVANLGVYHERSKIGKVFERAYRVWKGGQEKLNTEGIDFNYRKWAIIKNLFRIFDMLIRYWGFVRKARREGARTIIFDRYFYDILLQSRLDFFTRLVLKLVPKPQFTFFLYADPQELYKRKRERPSRAIKEQIEKFFSEAGSFCKFIPVETKTRQQTLFTVLSSLNNKKFLSCI